MISFISIIFMSCWLCVFTDDHVTAPLYGKNEMDSLSDSHHFIMFFAPWCGHCKRLSPTWDKLSRVYDGNQVKVARVDCTVETELCSENEVTGYPTLKFFKTNGESVRYKGQRDLDSLSAFIQEQIDDDTGSNKKEETIPSTSVAILTEENFNMHVTGKNVFIKFYAPWCGHCQRLAPTWDELAERINNKDATIAKVDCTENRDICQKYEVTGYPTLLWFSNGENKEKYQGARDIIELEKYVNKQLGREPKEKTDDAKDGEDDVAEDSAVLQLTAENFSSRISKGTAFVKFYAPWCGFCKKLAPTWSELAGRWQTNHNVLIVKVDCTKHQQLCADEVVLGFPTLHLYRNGDRIDTFNGDRDIESLNSYLINKIPHDEL